MVKGPLEVAYKDINLVSKEEFTNIRRMGIGASDASVILGLQSKWKTSDDIIKEKLQHGISEEEREVGNKAVVRKGSDLEPLILTKASEWLDTEIEKPTDMYRLTDAPWLTVNFDGITTDSQGTYTVVEAKLVSAYGEKYYDKMNAIKTKADVPFMVRQRTKNSFLMQDIQTKAKACGVPDYYYAQVQQQLLGVEAEYGYLAALFDKDWELKIFLIPKDATVQARIVRESKKVWDIIERARE